jgi:hypothetical protein
MPAPPSNFVIDPVTKILTFDEPDPFDTISVRMSTGWPPTTLSSWQFLSQSTNSFNLNDVLQAINGTDLVEHMVYRLDIGVQSGGNASADTQEWHAVGEPTPYPSLFGGDVGVTGMPDHILTVTDNGTPNFFSLDNLDYAASYFEDGAGTQWPMDVLGLAVASDGHSYSLRVPFDASGGTYTLVFVGNSTAPGSHSSTVTEQGFFMPPPPLSLFTPPSEWNATDSRFDIVEGRTVITFDVMPNWLQSPTRDIRLTLQDSHGVDYSVVSPGAAAAGHGTVTDYSSMFGKRFLLVDGIDAGPVASGADQWPSRPDHSTPPDGYTPFANPPTSRGGRMVGGDDPLNILGPGAHGDLGHPELNEQQVLDEGGGHVPASAGVPRSRAPFVPAWVGGVQYAPGQMLVSPTGLLTVCALLHTATDYATDLAAGNWVEAGGGGASSGTAGIVPPVQVVSANNEVTVSPPAGAATIDGYDVQTGDRVLLATAPGSDGGVWVVSTTGDWSRPDDWGDGSTIPDGTLIPVAYGPGSVFYGSLWQTEGLILVGTDGASFTCLAAYNGWQPVVSNGAAQLQAGMPVAPQLPTTDPGIPGQLWDNAGVVTVSGG